MGDPETQITTVAAKAIDVRTRFTVLPPIQHFQDRRSVRREVNLVCAHLQDPTTSLADDLSGRNEWATTLFTNVRQTEGLHLTELLQPGG